MRSETWEGSRLMILQIQFSHSNRPTKPADMTKKPSLSAVNMCTFFSARQLRKKPTTVLLFMFQDKYFSQSSIFDTCTLKLQMEERVSHRKQAFLQLNRFYFEISQKNLFNTI